MRYLDGRQIETMTWEMSPLCAVAERYHLLHLAIAFLFPDRILATPQVLTSSQGERVFTLAKVSVPKVPLISKCGEPSGGTREVFLGLRTLAVLSSEVPFLASSFLAPGPQKVLARSWSAESWEHAQATYLAQMKGENYHTLQTVDYLLAASQKFSDTALPWHQLFLELRECVLQRYINQKKEEA